MNETVINKVFADKIIADTGGGMGKVIAFTGFVQALRTHVGPTVTIHARTTWPDVFRGFPGVSRFFDPTDLPAYFAEDHQDFEVLTGEPYNRLLYRTGDEHIIEAWCGMHGIPAPKEIRGFLRIMEAEHRQAVQLMRGVPKNQRWIAFQPWGGHGSPIQQARSLPVDIAQGIVDALVGKAYTVFQFSAPHAVRLDKAIPLDPGKDQSGNQQAYEARTLFGILNLCDGFIGIDSSFQHAWTALGKKNGVVVWGATRPGNLGYKTNRNLASESCPTPGCNRPSVLGDLVGGRKPWICPYGEKCMAAFSPARIVEELEGANGWTGGKIEAAGPAPCPAPAGTPPCPAPAQVPPATDAAPTGTAPSGQP